MSKHIRQSVALFLLLWLPLFGASAMAESLAMQWRAGNCHESMSAMDHHAMMTPDGHHMMQHDMAPQTVADNDASSCSSCAICHIASSAFLIPLIVPHVAKNGSQTVPYIPPHFTSHLSAPLDPPPLVAA